MRRLVNLRPARAWGLLLGILPFVLLLGLYFLASEARLSANPNDPLLPALDTMLERFWSLATEPSRRTGEVVLWSDTAASLQRLALGVGLSMFLGLVLGILAGLLPLAGSSLGPLITALAMIPPLAVLPILFITFGVGELSKVMLILFGIAPFITRDIQQRVEELPVEQLIKAQSLGAGTWLIAIRIVLPQVLPRLLDATRLALGAAWLFLIAAEAIAATEGLGYRIFLVRRFMDMATILPYVLWITLLAFLLDRLLRWVNRFLFPWYGGRQS